MKLVAVLKLLPSQDQARCLKATLVRCNEAATWLAILGFQNDTFRQYDLHKLAYTDLRTRFDLTAQAAVRTIAKVADAFKINRKRPPTFRSDGAQPYDDRILRFVKNISLVSIWTIEGRITIPLAMGDHQRRLMTYRKGEVDLCFVRGKWYLAATCDIPETDEFKARDWLGVDFGIVNLAVDSDGNTYTGAKIEQIRSHLARRRTGLQRRGTKAAKRRLRKLSGREARFRRHTNHVISKEIVASAERTSRGIVLEDLKHIRKRVTAPRRQRSRLHSWPFAQLRAFTSYKSRRLGVPLVCVDPKYTSQTCNVCGCINKRNRPNQSTFSCIVCRHTTPADFNAARNLRAKAVVTLPYVLAA